MEKENGKFIAVIYVASMMTALLSTVAPTDNFKANAVEQTALTANNYEAPAKLYQNAGYEMQANVD
ncbi:hypothetical protein SAMN05216386_2567 [Nitrosospira briensis]|uniref:Uncharacterized protein n=1 Tax=Nitrosospira briensis TaxID=35799 RepID=A0A1I5EAK0_9PROT|nr:hypothetical protein [Nitrosospira briensis]SFO08286.1 hypothetical protein SAMN05216386_2567 [Nitrosospira briensis]